MGTKQRNSDAQNYPGMLADHSLHFPLPNELLSALEEIEKCSRVLLEKGATARVVDKDEDSKEAVRLIEQLREAITHYQVSEHCILVSSMTHVEGQISEQQAIYNQMAKLTVSVYCLVYILLHYLLVPLASPLLIPS